MPKFYFLTIFALSFLLAQAQITLNCVKDVTLNTDSFNCHRFVYNIDPILPRGVSPYRVTYRLEGATKGKGDGSASGLRFEVGRTRVTYTFPLSPVLECSFYVTILNKELIIPDRKELPPVSGNCSVKIDKAPGATNKCTGERLVAITDDSLRYTTPGVYQIYWRYVMYDQTVLTQVQTVTIYSSFVPDRDSLPVIVGGCSVEAKVPEGVDKCTNRRISATTKDPLKYNRPGTYIIHWTYVDNGATVFKQNQQLVVREKASIIPDADSLSTIIANCSITLDKFPTAKNSCTGAVLRATPLSPVKYDTPGDYTIRWLYNDGNDTLTQVQRLIVRPGMIIPDLDTLNTVQANCFVTVTTYPTAKNSCSGAVITGTSVGPLKYDKPGTYFIKWVYSDKTDTLVQEQKVIVSPGGIIPDFDSLPVIYADCSVTISEFPTAKNSCTGSVLKAVPLSPAKYNQEGSYVIKWAYIDHTDTLIQLQQVVIRGGKIKADVDTLPVLRGYCSIVIDKYPTARHGCIDSVLIADPLSPLKYDQPGKYFIKWRFAYKQDTLVQTQEVVVENSRLVPEMDSLPVLTGNCVVNVTKTPTAKDPCSGTIVTATTKDPLVYQQRGNYFIRWRFANQYDTLVQVQTVIVNGGKIVPDSMSLPVLRGCVVQLTTSPTATNSCTNQSLKGTTNDSVFYDIPGTYTVRWIYRDKNDTLHQLQLVEVLKGTLVPGEDTLPTVIGKCSAVVSKKPTARNSCNGSVISGTTTDATVYEMPGTYKITWSFYDASTGDRMTQSQLVVVEDAGNLTPDLSLLPDLVNECSVTVTTVPTASNSCNGSKVTASTIDPVIYSKPGKYIIHWNYTFRNQVRLTQVQNVIITGKKILIAEVQSLPELTGICSVVVSDTPVARSKCNSKLVKAITNDRMVYSAAGKYTIKWLYIDGSDTLMQEQSVNVVSNGRLVPDKVFLPPVMGDCEVRITQIPTATNNCSRKKFAATTPDPLAYSMPGTYTIHWTYKEGTNVVQQNQVVTVRAVPEDIKVGPNPTSGEFRIIRTGCGLVSKITLQVYDIVGRVLETKQYSTSDDIHFGGNYPRGAYIAQLMWGEKRFVFKLIKR